MLEDRPILRERLLAVSAISAVLFGGAMAMNSIVTGGWQWGVASASTHRLYYDDVGQQWSEPTPSVPAPQPVALASASFTHTSDDSAVTPEAATANARDLEGDAAAVSLTSYAPQPRAAVTQPLQQAAPLDDAASKARYDQLEADISQADPQQNYVQNIPTPDSALPRS